MSELEAHLKSLDMCIWELSEAFKDLPDDDLWTRPDPRLLSAGELAAHIAYWEAQTFFADAFESALLTPLASYYTSNVPQPFVLPMEAAEVYNEVTRIHNACKAAIAELAPNAEDQNPHREGWTWSFALQYQVFHIAYHTGQIYSVRHLLGHETPDN